MTIKNAQDESNDLKLKLQKTRDDYTSMKGLSFYFILLLF
jgi:hypothetical protein